MKLTITMDMDNAAFEGENWAHEAGRILRKVADELDAYHEYHEPGDSNPLIDYNGNKVGVVTITEDDREEDEEDEPEPMTPEELRQANQAYPSDMRHNRSGPVSY